MVEPTIQNTLGAVEIGVIIAVFLFGIITLQFEAYLPQFWDDGWVVRTMVLSLMFLELMHTICIVAEGWMGTIIFYGRMAQYQHHPWMGGATMIGGLITGIVQSFFSYRAWKALPNPARYIGVVCGVATCIRAIGGVFLGVQVIRAESLAQYQANQGWLIRTLLASGTAIDVLIAGCMTYFLLTKRRSGFQSTTILVDRLVGYTIRTGLVTSATSVAVLATFQSAPKTFVWVGVYVVLAKLYSNSMLSALNERRQLRGMLTGASGDYASGSGNTKGGRHPTNGSRVLDRHGASSTSAAINIKMNAIVTCDVELEKDTQVQNDQSQRYGNVKVISHLSHPRQAQ